MKKHSTKDIFDQYACALCGDKDIYNGIIFKGHFVCEDCVEYVSSGTVTADDENGKIIFSAENETENKKDGEGKIPEK